jgi:hypothetical protein
LESVFGSYHGIIITDVILFALGILLFGLLLVYIFSKEENATSDRNQSDKLPYIA